MRTTIFKKTTNFLSFLLLAVMLLSSCVSHEQKMIRKYGEKPDWVKNKPVSNSYYYGVGIVNKSTSDYRNAAVKDALDNLINEISVEISSSSIFSTLETDASFNQEYSQNIQVSSKEALEGYEMTGSWEDEHHYYVIYQLSKAKHKQLKAKRLKTAIDRALQTYQTGEELKSKGLYKQAIVSEVQALEILMPYLDQEMYVDVNGKNVNLAVEIVHSIKSIESDVFLKASFLEKYIKVGQSISQNELYVEVTNGGRRALSNIPVLFEYKTISTKRKTSHTDNNGRANFNIGKIKHHKKHQEIFVSVDFDQIIKEGSNNRLLHKLISYKSINRLQIDLHVQSPTVFVSGLEYLDGKEFSANYDVKSQIQHALIENKFQISESRENADLELVYNIKSSTLVAANPLYVISSSGTVTVKEKGTIIFSKNVDPQKAGHLTQKEAVNESIKKLSPRISNRIVPQFTSQYFTY